MTDDYYRQKFDNFTPMTDEQKQAIRNACASYSQVDLDRALASALDVDVQKSMEPFRRIMLRLDHDVALLVEVGIDPSTIMIVHFNDMGVPPAMGIMVAGRVVRKYQTEIVGL